MKRITNPLFDFDKSLIKLAFVSILIGLMPLVIYAWGRGAEVIPSAEQWELLGYNHGPWWEDQWSLFLILMPMLINMIFCFVTMAIGIYRSGMNHRLSFIFILHTLILNIVQVILFFAQMHFVLWTID